MAQSKGQGGKAKLNPLLIAAGVLVLVVVIVLVAYVIPENARSDSYNKAMAMIEAEDMEAAAAAFEKLGGYKDSATYAAYAKAVADVKAGQNLQEAGKTLAELSNILDRANWAAYADARAAEDAGEYASAIARYKELAGFGDSADRIASLENAQYDSAVQLVEEGKLEEAKAIFDTLPEIKDSAKYLAYIDAVGTEDANDAIGKFKALEGFLSSADQIATLETAQYEAAVKLVDEAKLSEAKAIFDTLPEIEDSAQYLAYIDAAGTEDANDAIGKYKALDGFLDSAERIAALETAQYEAAVKLVDEAKLSEAKAIFDTLPEIKDSAKYLAYIDAMGTEDLPEAIAKFKALDGFLDSATAVDVAQETLYESAKAAFATGDMDNAVTLFVQSDMRQDSADYIAFIEAGNMEDPLAALAAFRALAEKGFAGAEGKVSETSQTLLDQAKEALAADEIDQAEAWLIAIDGFGDSADYLAYVAAYKLAQTDPVAALSAFRALAGNMVPGSAEQADALVGEIYESAKKALEEGDRDGALVLFRALGQYEDSGDYMAYLYAAKSEVPADALVTYKALAKKGFLDSEQIVIDIIAAQYEAVDELIDAQLYDDARLALDKAEDTQDKPSYAAYLDGLQAAEAQDAMAAFATIPGFKDADERLEATKLSMYEEATALVIQDKLEDARPLFLTLGAYEDSAKYVRYIEARGLEAEEPDKAREIYAELDTFLDSAQRAAPPPVVPTPEPAPEPDAPTTEEPSTEAA